MTSARLKKYQSMRDFKKTAEPKGRKLKLKSGRLQFVVQEHHASRLHYDFRLEMDGVLKSWAVPKGPSLDPSEKRLAVHVEDHPLEYGKFEGVIPKGQYGAGQVMIWDRGTWTPEGDMRDSYKNGKMKFHLEGQKLRGTWNLVQMKGERSKAGKNWLLIKDKVDSEISSAEVNRLTTNTGSRRSQVKRRGASKDRFPVNLKPELATLQSSVPEGSEWLHEIKFDGYRLLAFKQKAKVKLLSRGGNDFTPRLKQLSRQISDLPAETCILDGELVALNKDGKSDFQLLQLNLKENFTESLHYVIFDLLYLNGFDLREFPLIERKKRLQNLLDVNKPEEGSLLRYSDHLDGGGKAFFKQCCKRGLEGVISKRKDSRYSESRSRSWVKVKCSRRQEFVIGGFTKPSSASSGFGALLLGYYQGKKLVYCGRVGTEFSTAVQQDLANQLKKIERENSPFSTGPEGGEKIGVRWVAPQLVCEVRFNDWTAKKRLRHPTFIGMRLDKPASEVHLEVLEVANSTIRGKRSKSRQDLGEKSDGKNQTYFGVELTHPDRILYDTQGYTKRDLASYYSEITEFILPHIVNRPLSILRCPKGVDDKCFFQKHFPSEFPAELTPTTISESGGPQQYILLKDAAGLLRLVQLGVLEIHTWGAEASDIERPDTVVFDLDPGEGIQTSDLVRGAFIVREHLQQLNLKCFVRTTGGKGLHVVVPIVPNKEWPEVKEFSKTLSEWMAKSHPTLFVAKMTKKIRVSRIYIDYLRNSRGATSIALFSTRARNGATVSYPLAWENLNKKFEPSLYTIKTVPNLLRRRRKDPWEDFLTLKQDLWNLESIV